MIADKTVKPIFQVNRRNTFDQDHNNSLEQYNPEALVPERKVEK